MFRHVVMFRFVPDVTDAQRQAMVDGLATLPAAIPQLRSYVLGPDAGVSDGNWDFAIVADFDRVEDWRIYTADATHQAVIAERIRPIVAERAAVQFTY
ncbi:MAG TPA: Dabb family protein [Acidimicrobiales bacterium]